MFLLDAHTHLDHYTPAECDAALAEIAAQRIVSVAVAMNPTSYAHTRAIAARNPLIMPCFGVHPWQAHCYANALDELTPLIDASPMLGEIGLDYLWDEDPAHYPAQRAVFAHFLAHASTNDTVVNLHTKAAEDDVVALLERFAIRRAIVHWYSGPPAAFAALVARGCWFSFGVETPYNPVIQEFARATPLDQLLTETDGPEGLRWLTGDVGMPHHISVVLATLAAIKGVSIATLQAAIVANWQRLLGNDPRLARWTI
jgi:TatD DNase family protein